MLSTSLLCFPLYFPAYKTWTCLYAQHTTHPFCLFHRSLISLPNYRFKTFLYTDGECVTNSSWQPSSDSVQHYRTEVNCRFDYSGKWFPRDIQTATGCHPASGPGKIHHHQSTPQKFGYSKTVDWKNADEITSFNCTVNGVDIPTQHLLAESSKCRVFLLFINLLDLSSRTRRQWIHFTGVTAVSPSSGLIRQVGSIKNTTYKYNTKYKINRLRLKQSIQTYR